MEAEKTGIRKYFYQLMLWMQNAMQGLSVLV